MSKKKKNYKYRVFVENENIGFIGDIKKRRRYLLSVPLKNTSNKSILVIMKNPSAADKNKSDHTINNVLKFCNKKGYSIVYIMNLYAYYATNPKCIAKLISNGHKDKAIGKFNNLILKCVLNKVDEVIVAWGSDTFGLTADYKDRIVQVTNLIRNKKLFYVESIGGDGWYPKHAQVWSVNKEIDLDKWEPSFIS